MDEVFLVFITRIVVCRIVVRDYGKCAVWGGGTEILIKGSSRFEFVFVDNRNLYFFIFVL